MAVTSSVTFADLLRHHRTAAGLTQEELAARAGLSVDAISTLERGARRRPRKETVALLADALTLPEEERAAFAAAARRTPAAFLAATPPGDTTTGINGRAAFAAADGALPHGAVTFLFTDIERSTRLLQQLGDRYAEVLTQVQALLRSVWTAHSGHELGTQGDRFFSVFAYADDALAAAAAAQLELAAHSWPDGAAVRLRMGLHSGPALLTAGRYVGLEVHRAGCIAAAGHGGQVVVSGALAEQVAKFGYELPAGTKLRDLGKHRLASLPHRQQLYELVLPELLGMPATYPSLRTLDAWPGLRADLTAVVCMSAVLLSVVGLLLPLAVPGFPWAIGLGAAALAVMMLLGVALVQPIRRGLQTQWRDARKPVTAVTSTLLSLVVVVTALFITKPPIVLRPAHAGYDFSYTPHQPTHTGGSVVIGTVLPIHTLTPPILNGYMPDQVYRAIWNACLVRLPDLTLPNLDGWKPDQCVEVPTNANGGESRDEKTTIFHIDPRAEWSDGQPLTADDFIFAFRMVTDPNVQGEAWICGCSVIIAPWSLMQLTKVDERTVRIDWTEPYVDYLSALARLTPLPVHVYASGPYAGVYDRSTGAYNSALARRLAAEGSFNLWIPVDNGPFTVQRVEGYPFPESGYQASVISTAQRLVLARNTRFFSNFFHHPSVLDEVTYETVWSYPPDPTGSDKLIAAYRRGDLTVEDSLGSLDLTHLEGIPQGEMATSPIPLIHTMGFNQRGDAPNAQANGRVSIFVDPNVRKAFIEAFDRCGALKAALGLRDCNDPNFHTDEHAAPPSPDYDSTATLPAYNPTDAAKLLNQAGYQVVGGVRRFKDGTTPLQLVISPSGYGGTLPPFVDVAKRLQQDYMRNLQIAVQIQIDDGTMSVTGAFDMMLWQEGVGPDPVLNFSAQEFDSSAIPSKQNPDGENFLGLNDPWVVAQEQAATQTYDEGQRNEIYKEIVRHITEQFDFLPLIIDADTSLVKPRLCNFKKGPDLGAYLWNIADWYVAPSCT